MPLGSAEPLSEGVVIIPLHVFIDVCGSIGRSHVAMMRAQNEMVEIPHSLANQLAGCAKLIISDEPAAAYILQQLFVE